MIRRNSIAYGVACVVIFHAHSAVAEGTFVENAARHAHDIIRLNASVTKYLNVVPRGFPISAQTFGVMGYGSDVLYGLVNVPYRMNDERIGLGRAAREQFIVSGSSFLAGKIGGSLLAGAACTALTAGWCLAAIGTVAVGSYVVGQIPDQLFRAHRDFEIARQTDIETERRRLEAYSKTPAFQQRQAAAQQPTTQRQAAQPGQLAQPGQPATIAQPRMATAPTGSPSASTPGPQPVVQPRGLPAAIVTPAPSTASNKSDDWLRAIINNPKETREARAIAAIALGKDPWVILGQSRPSKPAAAATAPGSDDWLRAIMNNPKETPQARAIAAIALGKDPAVFVGKQSSRPQAAAINVPRSASAPSRQSDDWLRAIMNNPKETQQARAIAAIALGKDPSAVAASSLPPGPQPATTAAAPTAQKIASAQPAARWNARATGKVASAAAPPPLANVPSPASAPTSSRQPLKSLGTNVARLTPSPSPPAAPRTPSYYVAPHAAVTGFQRPGGISLSRAAAERMALNFELEGSYVNAGEIVLSGRPSAAGFDAALFLTAVRLACQPDDPYFSLDPDDGRAWSNEGHNAAEALWKKISGDFRMAPGNRPASWNNMRNGLSIRAVSARHDYARLWTTLAADYPNFKTRLVFHPLWLGETRFGEILYRADVLLKELTGGVPALQSTPSLRAKSIAHYVSSDERSVARRLLTLVESNQEPTERQWRGHRLWFDLVPKTEAVGDVASPDGVALAASPAAKRHGGPAGTLRALLKSRGHFSDPPVVALQQATLGADGNALDVSKVYPKMFVRRHDHATGKDIPGHDEDLDALSTDVNERSARYASAYHELRDLVSVFRAYIVAVKIAKREPRICAAATSSPLLDSEKVATALPRYHPSELFVTVATYVYSSTGKRGWLASINRSINGGIALRGREFLLQEAEISRPTPITAELSQELADGVRKTAWEASSGRRLVALRIDADDGADSGRSVTATLSPTVTSIPREPPANLLGFGLHAQSRVSGKRLNSIALRKDLSADAAASQRECAKACLGERDCVAFELDQSQNRCNIYSEVFKTFRDPQWIYGLRKKEASSR